MTSVKSQAVLGVDLKLGDDFSSLNSTFTQLSGVGFSCPLTAQYTIPKQSEGNFASGLEKEAVVAGPGQYSQGGNVLPSPREGADLRSPLP